MQKNDGEQDARKDENDRVDENDDDDEGRNEARRGSANRQRNKAFMNMRRLTLFGRTLDGSSP